jgi:cobalt-zinc-cadmium efflux system protein
MAIVAAAGLVVNIIAFLVRHGAGADNHNLNMRGAMLHVLGDLLGSVVALVAAGIIVLTGWMPADPVLSILVTLISLRGAWRVVLEAGHILLERSPAELDVKALVTDLTENIDGLERIHHVHAWSITQDRCVVTLHAVNVSDLAATNDIATITKRFKYDHEIHHPTM